MIEIGAVRQEIADKTRQRDQLEADLEDIREAREQVQAMSSADLQSFGGTISSMTSTPNATIKDAEDILTWLDNGAPDSGRPSYLTFRTNNNAKSCEDPALPVYHLEPQSTARRLTSAAIPDASMANYLREYGRGVMPFCTNPTSVPE
ncbi:uncharacterized protein BO97DRAFT_414214 [Aspergillus homomorphus CBS 101889]|uniref:Uncharacterized protein n=1 Tax=Aspergillus homomorphus (strain CBS 101889) TaxID=1450537 RepID=A0A395HXB6_ASPHC|nr:hypothetical protein BO97DRAFT_414214 [Aspergillus homomorphus CBS 101889]RAL12430.1 hypothetical protein BO97DRAFT_414214 [Aspergillus homomorphus CBS 101889]